MDTVSDFFSSGDQNDNLDDIAGWGDAEGPDGQY